MYPRQSPRFINKVFCSKFACIWRKPGLQEEWLRLREHWRLCKGRVTSVGLKNRWWRWGGGRLTWEGTLGIRRTLLAPSTQAELNPQGHGLSSRRCPDNACCHTCSFFLRGHSGPGGSLSSFPEPHIGAETPGGLISHQIPWSTGSWGVRSTQPPAAVTAATRGNLKFHVSLWKKVRLPACLVEMWWALMRRALGEKISV